MSQRRKIAARAHRTLFRHDGMNACVEQGDQHLDGFFAHSAEALGEDVCAQQEHGPDFGLGKGLAQAAGMASHQIHLQVAKAVSRNANVRELAEAGIDAVDGNFFLENVLDRLAGRVHARQRGWMETDFSQAASYSLDLFEREILSREQ